MEDKKVVANGARGDQFRWTAIIEAIKTPLGFYALIVLAAEAIMATAVPFTEGIDRTLLVSGMLGILGILIAVVSVFAYIRPEALRGLSVHGVRAEDDSETRPPREDMRRQIRAETDEAFEHIDTKLHDDRFSLFLEAKTGDPTHGYENYLGLSEDSASLKVSAVREKIDALNLAGKRGHRAFKLAVTAQEIAQIEKRLEAMIAALPVDLFGGEFLIYRPVTETEWKAQQERRGQYLNRLREDVVRGINGLKKEFSEGG